MIAGQINSPIVTYKKEVTYLGWSLVFNPTRLKQLFSLSGPLFTLGGIEAI